MLPSVVVISRLHHVRQAIARRLELLGARVAEYAEVPPLSGLLAGDRPDVVLLDVEDTEWSWGSVVDALASSPWPVGVVLLARRIGIDEAGEAKRRGVAGVILKPFREEEHLARLWGLLCRVRGVAQRRAQPRYYLEDAAGSALTMPGDRPTPCRIVNVSAGGACLAVPAGVPAELGVFVSTTPAKLAVGGVHLGATCRVVHRGDHILGVAIDSLSSGKLDFLEYLGRMQSRVFGSRRIRGPW